MTDYPAGHLLAIDHGPFQHVGISDGNGFVYENSYRRGGRGRVPIATFARGNELVDLGLIPGGVSPAEVVRRAERLVRDPRRYHIINNNCEHFVHEVSGVGRQSPQIRQWAMFAATTALTFTPVGGAVKTAAWGLSLGSWLVGRSRRTAARRVPRNAPHLREHYMPRRSPRR